LTAGIWQFVTDLGDSAVTVTLAGFILFFLVARERWRQVGAWAVSVAVCAIGTMAVKLLFHSCLLITPAANISGHTAMSTTVYGGLALLLTTRSIRWPGYATYLAAILLVLAIAASRIILHAHQWCEVLAGLAVGVASVLLFRQLAGPGERPIPVAGLLTGAAILAVLMHGIRWPGEAYLVQLAALFRAAGMDCGQL
jgi:membrane-associated phospholipid phosphatase